MSGVNKTEGYRAVSIHYLKPDTARTEGSFLPAGRLATIYEVM